MKECDAPESNSTTAEVSLIKKHTNDHIQSFLGFLHNNMIDLHANIVLLGSNRNIISSMGRCRGRHSCLRRASTQIGALVGIVTA
jgi:hypothetical protein